METKIILLVDDEEEICITLVEMLSLFGYETEAAASGEEALAVFDKAKHALLITDYHLPGMPGDELIRRLLLRCPTLQVIALTGGVTSNAEEALLAAGAHECLGKPFDIGRFREAVGKALEGDRRANH